MRIRKPDFSGAALAADVLAHRRGCEVFGGRRRPTVAAAVPGDRRGTASGVFALAGSVATLLASILAGALWQSYGVASTCMVGAMLTTLGLVGAVTLLRRHA